MSVGGRHARGEEGSRPQHEDGRLPVSRLAQAAAGLRRLAEDYGLGGAPAILDGVSSLQQAQASLLNAQEEYRRLLENTPGVACELAADGTILFVNRRVREVTGYEPEDLVGHNWWFTFFPGQLRSQVDDLHRRLQAGDVQSYEVVVRRADGREASLECSATNTYDAGGSIHSTTLVAVDTSRRRAAEAARQEAERLWEIVLSGLQEVAVLFAAPDGIVEWYNQVAPSLLGVDPQDLDGGLCCRVMEGREEDEACPTALALSSGQTQVKEIVAPGGRTLLLRSTPVEDESGQSVGVMHMALDVTDRKDCQAEVQRLTAETDERVALLSTQIENALQDLDSFSGAVAQDVRGGLRALRGLYDAALAECSTGLPQAAPANMQRLGAGLARLHHLVEDLMALSQLARRELAIEDVDPGEVVRSVLNDLRRGLAGRAVLMMIHDLPPCRADSELLRLVYSTLLAGALEASRNQQDAMVEVGCRDEAGGHVYYVRDNGDSPMAAPQAGAATAPSAGTGADSSADGEAWGGPGLAVVRRVVERHGGRFWAEPESGQGHVYYFTWSDG